VKQTQLIARVSKKNLRDSHIALRSANDSIPASIILFWALPVLYYTT